MNLVEQWKTFSRLSNDPFTFIEEEAHKLWHLHNDAIVINLRIARRKVYRILIDNGSSSDILFKFTLHKMDLVGASMKRALQSLKTPELGNSSSQPANGPPLIQGHNPQPTSEGQLLITSLAVDTALFHAMSAGLNVLHVTSYQGLQPTILATPTTVTGV